MSAVHAEIALAALGSLRGKAKELFAPFGRELSKASEYPDIFADFSMPEERISSIDPEAPKLIYSAGLPCRRKKSFKPGPDSHFGAFPPNPDKALARKISTITEKDACLGIVPLRYAHLAGLFMRKALESLAGGDARLAAKFCGVYSHVIGDIGEPVHALTPHVIDCVLPPPSNLQGLELHFALENNLKAKPFIGSYSPSVLGHSRERAEIGIHMKLAELARLAASLAVPMAAALYKGDVEESRRLGSIAESASAKLTADFLQTVAVLHFRHCSKDSGSLDLRKYPVASTDMDMLYCGRPSIDCSPLPYSGGRSVPMFLFNASRCKTAVKGIGMIATMAPPFDKRLRTGSAEYYLVPGGFKTFKAMVGVNASFTEALTPTLFKVYADGVEVASCGPLREGDAACKLEADIRGARWLKLGISYAANPTPEEAARLNCAWASHAIWAYPALSTR
jgi:hypothetical protein